MVFYMYRHDFLFGITIITPHAMPRRSGPQHENHDLNTVNSVMPITSRKLSRLVTLFDDRRGGLAFFSLLVTCQIECAIPSWFPKLSLSLPFFKSWFTQQAISVSAACIYIHSSYQRLLRRVYEKVKYSLNKRTYINGKYILRYPMPS